MADKRHPRRTRRGNLVGEPISIRRGAIRGNPFPRPAVSGLPLNSVISPGCVARSINFFVPVARVPVHVHSSVVRCRCTPPRPHKLTPFLFIFQWLARNPPSPLQPPLSLFLFCFVSAGGYNNPNSKGRGLSTEKSAWKHSNYPFETNVSRVIRLATPPCFRLFGYYVLFRLFGQVVFARDRRSSVKPGVEIKGGVLLFFRASCHELIIVLIPGVDFKNWIYLGHLGIGIQEICFLIYIFVFWFIFFVIKFL